MQSYWSFREKITILDGIALKGRKIIIPKGLQDKAPKQLHLKHRDIEKTRLLAFESIYWINMNANIEEMLKMPHLP